MRKRIIAGNWKMYKTVPEALSLVEGLKGEVAGTKDVEIVVCPPFTALYPVKEALRGTNIELGAQDLYWEEQGAFTGEVSPGMLKSVGCAYVIIGHSERRALFGETDAGVNKKVKSALAYDLVPIICVGETLEQREAGKTERLVRDQVVKALAGVKTDDVPRLIFAYEPVWAIGTGRSSTGGDANKVIRMIRETVGTMFNGEAASRIRIQYGGSVKPENITEFLSQPDIDGALVGGASLDAIAFARIVKS